MEFFAETERRETEKETDEEEEWEGLRGLTETYVRGKGKNKTVKKSTMNEHFALERRDLKRCRHGNGKEREGKMMRSKSIRRYKALLR